MQLELVNEAKTKFTLLGLRLVNSSAHNAGNLESTFAVCRKCVNHCALAERIRISSRKTPTIEVSRLHSLIRCGVG